MKKFLVTISLTFLFVVGVWAIARPYVRGETMKQEDVCKKWGRLELNLDAFKAADPSTRATMACSILKSEKTFLGKDVLDIRSSLGDFDGFYFSDMYPTYMIQVGKDHSEDSWQLVFLIDRNQKISGVVVHKNCCKR